MKKVKNNSGATILMALLLILLATAVGAAVLTAAVSAARHLRSDREAQQNYLTVSSAAELIRDSINGQTYQRTLTEYYNKVDITDKDGIVIGVRYDYDHTEIVQTPSDGKIGGIMGAWLADCIADKSDTTKDFASFKKCEDTITVTVNAGEGSLRPVQAKFSAEPSTITFKGEVLYISIIQVELSLAPENGKADDCRMTLTMRGTLQTEGDPVPDTGAEKTSYPFTTTVTWGSPKITKGIGTKEVGT